MQNAFSEIKHSQNSYFTLTAQSSEKDTKNSNFAQNEKKIVIASMTNLPSHSAGMYPQGRPVRPRSHLNFQIP